MKKTTRTLSVFAVSALLLAGCGASPAPETAPTTEPTQVATPTVTAPAEPVETLVAIPVPETWEAGVFEFTTPTGTAGTITLPSTPQADVEALRQQIGAPPLTYAMVHVDNRAGSEDAPINEVRVYDTAGQEYVFMDVYSLTAYTPEWDLSGTDMSNMGVDLGNRWMNLGNVGQVSDIPMVGQFPESQFPTEGITRVVVTPSGMDEVEAYPEGTEPLPVSTDTP